MGGAKSSTPFPFVEGVVVSACLNSEDEDAGGTHANLGALFASSWTKQRFAVRCHAAQIGRAHV